jgi:hypothetical protein
MATVVAEQRAQDDMDEEAFIDDADPNMFFIDDDGDEPPPDEETAEAPGVGEPDGAEDMVHDAPEATGAPEDAAMEPEVEMEDTAAFTFSGHTDAVYSVAISPVLGADGAPLLASGGGDDAAYIWSTGTVLCAHYDFCPLGHA